jgi:hypothetical protein
LKHASQIGVGGTPIQIIIQFCNNAICHYAIGQLAPFPKQTATVHPLDAPLDYTRTGIPRLPFTQYLSQIGSQMSQKSHQLHNPLTDFG